MKNKLFFSLVAIMLATFLYDCKKSNLTARDTSDTKGISLYACDEKQQQPYICFDSLLTDSRCPAVAECFWQGTALIKVSFRETGHTHQFNMSLQGFPSIGYPNDTTVSGYNIVFTRLEPYPTISHSQQQTPTAYFSITP